MTLKATWCWNGKVLDGTIVFGFSETWYSDDAPATLLPKMQTFAEQRTNILALGTSLYGFRIADVSPGSRAYTETPRAPVVVEGHVEGPNVPNDSALARCYGSVAGTVKRFWWHCLPDNAIDQGSFRQALDINRYSRQLINFLATEGFKFRYSIQSAPTAKVLSIDASGNVTMVAPLVGVVPGSLVQLYHVRGVDGRGKRGKYYVETRTSDSAFKLAHWPGDLVAASGSLRLVQYGYTSIQAVPNTGFASKSILRPGTRKVGRPFGQLRGRAVARR